MAELYHECGIAAVYHFLGNGTSRLAPRQGPTEASRLIPRLLVEIQNRGQLAAGMSSFHPRRDQLIKTYKDVGTVSEVFRLNHEKKQESIMREYASPVAIGHVRYATCGKDDRSYAQPFERSHIERSKWFSFAFNGQLANYQQLKDEILSETDFHLARDTDTEVLHHLLSQEISRDPGGDLLELLYRLSARLDGAYNIAFLSAKGDMFVCRDQLGIRPLCYAVDGPLDRPKMFAAASESVALANLGFEAEDIRNLPPGCAVIIRGGRIEIRQFVATPRRAHCFFEWIYFANVASTLDERSVYLARNKLGEELAVLEDVPLDSDTIVVPVPDTAKSAATGMAYRLGVPLLEGLIRNRYSGRTFIEGNNRAGKAKMKYTPLPEVLAGKRILLVEDTIVRSTTMKALVQQLRTRGRAREIHVRVACPPIVAPCFYGIDMSTVTELFAPNFMEGTRLTPEIEAEMAEAIGADSLRYLPLDSIARCIGLPREALCQACITGQYPTQAGRELYQIALAKAKNGEEIGGRTYEAPATVRG